MFNLCRNYHWEDLYLFREGQDGILRSCVAEYEKKEILEHCYDGEAGGHMSGKKTAYKVLQCGFFWPSLFRDASNYVKQCDKCQRVGNISKRDEMPLNNNQVIELFDIWGIDFMGPFPVSFGYEYILVAGDYTSKWVEAVTTRNFATNVVLEFLKKNIFNRFGIPRAIISDGGSHFCNAAF